MVLAASDTTKALSVTAICRLYLDFRLCRPSYMDSLNDRSLVALGRIRATLMVLVGAVVAPVPAPELELLLELELQAAAPMVRAMTSGTSHFVMLLLGIG